MMQAALPDAAAPAPGGQETSDLISADAAKGLRSLHEKIEDAFMLPDAGASPVVVTLPFRAGAERQAAAIGEMDARLERLESGTELAELRETMREMCSAISGLAAESERSANERDDKISDLAHALESQIGADRERLNALEIRVVDSEAGNARKLDDVHVVMRQLEERMRVGDAHNEDLAYNMRVLRGELAGLGEVTAALRLLEDRAATGDMRHEELARQAGMLKDGLGAAREAAAAAARQLEEKFSAGESRHAELAREMGRVKGDVLNQAAAAMREHQGRMEDAERQIGELKDRNARSAERIEALTDGLGSVGRKLDSGTERLAALTGDLIKLHSRIDADVSGAQLLAERLGTIETWIAKAHERERARAELHARLADSLLPPSV
jgi:chromosome segregation ATPase